MRIKGYGAGYQGQGQTGADRERAAAFRSRHSIGERIKGRVLRRDPSGLYWVQVGREELLARLEVQTEPGDILMFVVRALVPEIHLQALQGDALQDDLPGLVQRFRASRQVFETKADALLNVLANLPPLPDQRREAFAIALDGDADAARLHEQTQGLLARINDSLASGLGAVALYAPWLLPGVRRQEIVRRIKDSGGGFAEASMSGRMDGCGGLEVRLLSSPAECSLRLLAERPDQTGLLQVELAALVRAGLGVEPHFLGVVKFGAGSGAGVLTELLGDAPLWASGGLNTRV